MADHKGIILETDDININYVFMKSDAFVMNERIITFYFIEVKLQNGLKVQSTCNSYTKFITPCCGDVSFEDL